MLKAYYGSRISPNQTVTPEGYLICHNVPISRMGWQEYFPHEVNLKGENPIKVYRKENEVFSPIAIASFEGKPVTDGHPFDDVVTSNVGNYLKGVTTNVRRGVDAESEFLLADLIVYDPILISEIQAGKKEISCGYNYDLVADEAGIYEQRNIRGNHVAIVLNGRAGKRVRINDEKPKNRRREKVGVNKKHTLIGKILSAFAKDAEPEELAEASKMITESAKDEIDVGTDKPPVTTPQGNDANLSDGNAAVLEAINALKTEFAEVKATVAKLEAAPLAKDNEPEKNALDELEKELAADEEPVPEESITITDEVPVTQVADLPVNPIKGADSRASILAALKVMRPIVANIKDPVERKKAADSMAKTFREQLIVSPTNAYEKLIRPPKKKANDQAIDESEFGRNWAKKWNPHYKNKD